MHDARARLAGSLDACDRPASQRAHGWLAGWRILTEDYILYVSHNLRLTSTTCSRKVFAPSDARRAVPSYCTFPII